MDWARILNEWLTILTVLFCYYWRQMCRFWLYIVMYKQFSISKIQGFARKQSRDSVMRKTAGIRDCNP